MRVICLLGLHKDSEWFDSPQKTLHLQYPYGLQQNFVLDFKHSQFFSNTVLQKEKNSPITDWRFSSNDFNAGSCHNYVTTKSTLATAITLCSCTNKLSSTNGKDAEVNKQFPFGNDLNKIFKEKEVRETWYTAIFTTYVSKRSKDTVRK